MKISTTINGAKMSDFILSSLGKTLERFVKRNPLATIYRIESFANCRQRFILFTQQVDCVIESLLAAGKSPTGDQLFQKGVFIRGKLAGHVNCFCS